jgi:unsaturated pyranuronate lyase
MATKKKLRKKKPTGRRTATTKPEIQHVAWQALEMEQVTPQFYRHFLSGENVMLSRILLKKGFVVPFHQHHNEQVSFVLDGALKFIFEDREVVVNSGEVLVIPPNVPHKVEAIVDTVDFDVFSPPRSDWINKSDAYLRKPAQARTGPQVVG